MLQETQVSVMFLTQTSQYALRIMASVALARGAEPIRARDLAKNVGASPHYASKVLRKLVKAGLLRATKGHGGGFVLGRSATNVRLIQILDAVSAETQTKACIFGWRRCDSSNPCILHHRWNSVSSAFDEWARKTTLAEIQQDAEHATWLVVRGTPT